MAPDTHDHRDTDSDNKIKQSLYAVIRRILTPLISILLRNGIPFHVFTEIVKQCYVKVAGRELLIPGRKQTITRIATITGLPRKEVGRIKEGHEQNQQRLYSMRRHNRAARVISTWVREERFHNKRGQPASLSMEDEPGNFSDLVKCSGVDITPRTILNELLRSGAVGYLNNGRISLLSRSYVPAADNLEKMAMLGTDVRDLIKSISHNLTCEPGDAFFQRKTIYDNIPVEHIEKLRVRLREIAQAALEEFDRELAACDRDSNPECKGNGRVRVGMNLFYFEEEFKESEKPDE